MNAHSARFRTSEGFGQTEASGFLKGSCRSRQIGLFLRAFRHSLILGRPTDSARSDVRPWRYLHMGTVSSFITRGAEAVPPLFGGDLYSAVAPWRDLRAGRFRARHADGRSRTRDACPEGGPGRTAHRFPRGARQTEPVPRPE